MVRREKGKGARLQGLGGVEWREKEGYLNIKSGKEERSVFNSGLR